MVEEMAGRRVAILAADGVERIELEQPRQALDQAGARTELLSTHDGKIQAMNNDLDPAGTFPVDRMVADASVSTTIRCFCPAEPSIPTGCGFTPRRSGSYAIS
jgi:protease I